MMKKDHSLWCTQPLLGLAVILCLMAPSSGLAIVLEVFASEGVCETVEGAGCGEFGLQEGGPVSAKIVLEQSALVDGVVNHPSDTQGQLTLSALSDELALFEFVFGDTVFRRSSIDGEFIVTYDIFLFSGLPPAFEDLAIGGLTASVDGATLIGGGPFEITRGDDISSCLGCSAFLFEKTVVSLPSSLMLVVLGIVGMILSIKRQVM